ncbi:MAG: hypothetical protein JRL30_24300 [Deltaproteobacteria bacterium]|nr:hypothetical protein [Deltaproteobacteria bacterium]
MKINEKLLLRFWVAGAGVISMICFWFPPAYTADDTAKVYVGSGACKDCHETEFNNLVTFKSVGM